MNIFKRIVKRITDNRKIRRYRIDGKYIVVTRRGKYVVVKVNGKTVFNNIKTNQDFRQWFWGYKLQNGFDGRLWFHRLPKIIAKKHEPQYMRGWNIKNKK